MNMDDARRCDGKMPNTPTHPNSIHSGIVLGMSTGVKMLIVLSST
jgi:hypothetical protein